MGEYQYTALPSDRTSIRLLRLLPNPELRSTVECEIFPATLSSSENKLASYEALSYTWGDATNPVNIKVNGFIFPVTRNLHSGLQALRQAQQSRVLWVDAVCINQADLQECGCQVQIMWDIYSKASCVVVWLGPEEGESAIAMENFKKRDAQMRNEMRRHPRSPPDSNRQSDWCGCHAGRWQSFPSRLGVQKLLARKWFTRVWVLQEVAAARKVVVVCGRQIVEGTDFCLDVKAVAAAHPSIGKSIRSIRPAVELMSQSSMTFRKQSLPLLELIETFASWEATKKVDKIYSLLSFSSDAYDEPELRPDYTIPADVLARKIVKFAFPMSAIKQLPSDGRRDIVTFEIEGLILGTVKEKWSQRLNRRSWIFDARNTAGKLGTTDLAINPVIAKIFEQTWQINILTTRKLRLDDIICFLHGASRPSVLRFEHGQYTVIMLATPEPTMRQEEVGIDRGNWKVSMKDPDYFSQKIPQSSSSRQSWSDVAPTLAAESAGRQNFMLTWNPFQTPTEGRVSTFRPTINDPDIQWEARLESFYDTTKNEAEDIDRTPYESHNCKTISMLHQMYGQAEEEIKAGTSEYTISLHTAARANWVGTAKLLLDANAEVDGRDTNDATALCYAAALNHRSIVAALLEAGANVDAKSPHGSLGSTPLSLAAREGHSEVCTLLLQAGADPNNAEGASYLVEPAVKGFIETIRILLKAGARPEATVTLGPEANITPLCLSAELGHIDIVRELLDAGAPVNASTSSGTRAIHQAAMNGHTEVVRLLLAGGADINPMNKEGVTPLDFAVFRENFGTAQEIRNAGGTQNKTLAPNNDSEIV